MADAIPVADAGLLAAQATQGQAGVQAYKDSIASLQAQKQQATQTAMQEAALRGSPAGAAQSQSSIISTPYDQRIASLTEGMGQFQANQASQASRMNAYEGAVNEARTYIPQMTEMAVAPIRAMADYNVRNTEMKGQMDVAGINADTQLTLAKMAAAAAAAQRAAAKAAADAKAKASTLNQGELSSMMTRGGQSALQGGVSESEQVLGSNEAAVAQAIASAQHAAAANVNKAQSNRSDVNKVMTLAQLILNATLANDKKKQQAQVAQVSPQRNIIGHTGSGAPIYASPSMAPAPTAPSRQQSDAERYGPLMQAVTQRIAQIRGVENQQVTKAVSQYPTQILAAANTAMYNRSSYDPISGSRVLVSKDQAANLGPDARALLYGGQVGNINTLGGFQQQVEGAPVDQFGHPAAPHPSDYSAKALQDAMLRSAQALQGQGYTITDAQAQSALPNKGQSIYDFLAAGSGRSSAQDEYSNAVTEQTKTDKVVSVAQKAADDSEIRREFGRTLPPNLGTSTEILTQLSDPTMLQQYKDLQTLISDAKKANPKATRQAIADAVQQKAGGSVDQYALELALAKAGY
jgi:hypothetical protein